MWSELEAALVCLGFHPPKLNHKLCTRRCQLSKSVCEILLLDCGTKKTWPLNICKGEFISSSDIPGAILAAIC